LLLKHLFLGMKCDHLVDDFGRRERRLFSHKINPSKGACDFLQRKIRIEE
jgi:hypothetical protein